MRLLVLAGGFGTRLRSAVADIPKALAPVGDVPFLQLQIDHWLAQGIRKFAFLLHHQADQIIDFLRGQLDGQLKNCQVDWLVEMVPLDTGGALAFGVKQLDLSDDFLFVNADTWLGGGVVELIRARAPSLVVMHLADVSRYGQVFFDQNHLVQAFAEKESLATEGWINGGMGRLSVELFRNWDGKRFSLERDLYPLLVKENRLTAIPLATDFIDIGIPDDYQRFCDWVASGRQLPLCN
jgi:NDP-sugar pyrophosphorylase family protein